MPSIYAYEGQGDLLSKMSLLFAPPGWSNESRYRQNASAAGPAVTLVNPNRAVQDGETGLVEVEGIWQPGMVTRKTAPWPSRDLKSNHPPYCSTIRVAIDRPCPRPPSLVLKNGSNILEWISCAIPLPISATSIGVAGVPSTGVARTLIGKLGLKELTSGGA
jgi:hypothetical protein